MHIKVLSAVLAAAFGLAACSEQPAAQNGQPAAGRAGEKVVLKVAHFWPASAMSQKQILEPWCAKIAEASQQQMTCQIYPAMQLGGTPPQLADQAADGVADIVWTLPGYSAGRFPSVEVMELPFMAQGGETGSRAAWQIYQEFGGKDFAAFKPLAFNVHDRGHIHNNVRPITGVADFKGLKMRAPTRLTNKMLEALGATPVNVPLPGLADAVSKGVVDGYILPWEVVPTLKLHEMTRYHSEINAPEPALYSALFAVLMNKGKYDSLPDNLKKIIDEHSGAEFSAAIGKAWDDSVAAAKQSAAGSGDKVNVINRQGVEGIQAAAAKVEADWIAEMNGKGYDGAAIVKRAKELVAGQSGEAK